MKSALYGAVAAFLLSTTAYAAWQQFSPRPVTVSTGTFPEQLVFARSADGLVNGGVMFSTAPATRSVAVIWIHGWGVNFYQPTYVMAGRALAARGVTTIAVNTRMHDLGTSAGQRNGKRLRGGGYWGVASEEVRDIKAWIDFAEDQGFRRVVLVGHSAGWSAVRAYQANFHDPRVAGLVLASGAIKPDAAAPDPDLVAKAASLVEAGLGDDLLRLPGRSTPSFVSAATLLDIARTPRDLSDFFGVSSSNPAIVRVRVPVLAFFGTREPGIGTREDLDLLAASIRRHPGGPRRIDTLMIDGADHMYTGQETRVAEAIADWIDGVVLSGIDVDADPD